jgi:hypothetical protein
LIRIIGYFAIVVGLAWPTFARMQETGQLGCEGEVIPNFALVLEDARLQSGAGLGTGASEIEANEEAFVLETECYEDVTWIQIQAMRDNERVGWVEASVLVLSQDNSTETVRIYEGTCYIQPIELGLNDSPSLDDPISHLMAFEFSNLGEAPVFLFKGNVVSDDDVSYEGQTSTDHAVYELRARWVLRQSTRGIFGGETAKWNEASNWQVVVDCDDLQPNPLIEVTIEP